MKELNRKKAKINDRSPERVLQFGGGNFLRAFVDWMVDVLNKETAFNGSVVIVKPTASGDYDALRSQDGLFHVVLDGIKDGKSISQIELIQSVSRIIHPYKEWSKFLETAHEPGMKYIVSNTTEAGIIFNEEDRFTDEPPEEFPAKLTRWLYERYQYFNGSINRGCLILPCELIEQNGDVLRKTVLEYVSHWGLERQFKDWILKHNHFYNTLVDRIVSGYPEDRAEKIKKSIGFEDSLLVAGEFYHSWIISGDPVIQQELHFAETDLNVQFVDHISEYRELKVRVLNGAHTSLVPVGYLAGYRTVDACMGDKNLMGYLTKLLEEEVKPTLIKLSTSEVENFIGDVINRFRNPILAHQLIDISLNSFSKFKARLLPTLKDYIDINGEIPRRIVFSMACLILFYRGDFDGQSIRLNDETRNLEFARKMWTAYDTGKISMITLVDQFLSKYGVDRELSPYEEIRSMVADYMVDILKNGIINSLPGEV